MEPAEGQQFEVDHLATFTVGGRQGKSIIVSPIIPVKTELPESYCLFWFMFSSHTKSTFPDKSPQRRANLPLNSSSKNPLEIYHVAISCF